MKTSFFFGFGLFLSVANARADEITVSAATSLREVLSKIGDNYQKTAPQTQIHFNFGASGALQQQIEAGAPVDLFVSAAEKNMDELAKSGEIEVSTRRLLARGELVLIAPRGSKLKSIAELRLSSVQSLCLGGPGVPAGTYARQTLSALHLDAAVASKIVFCKDVRAVLAQVAAGNADAGFVYKTDALTNKNVRIVATAPPQSHEEVRYPMAVVSGAKNRADAMKFWNYLQSARAKAELKRFGFRGVAASVNDGSTALSMAKTHEILRKSRDEK